MKYLRHVMSAFALTLLGQTTMAAVVDFEDVSVPGAVILEPTITSGGFQFTGTAATGDVMGVYNDADANVCGGGCVFNGTQSLVLYNDDQTGPFEGVMSRLGGGAFDLLSFHTTTLFPNVPPAGTTLEVIGTLAAGGTVQQTFAFDSIPDNFQSETLTGFTSLSSVLFRSNLQWPVLDNIVVTIPEPGSLVLMSLGLGFVGLGLGRRRKA